MSLFERMPDRDVVAWNAVIVGCPQNGLFPDPISLFKRIIKIAQEGNREVQKFRKDAALCESMATVLNLEEEKRSVEIGPSASEDISDEPFSPGSSLTATTSQETGK
ncbi:hypothetical protein CJ030_MR5G019095 [Morella rubra]|uniref:Pentatricopeptide repeat-containing protein n=1 Tax=Morella rubra TaxID=262757 RepID=A0A6A1VI02_9ROSI|nr:hypothetical protein CJ030_MR5G019095 [Morella rubra]